MCRRKIRLAAIVLTLYLAVSVVLWGGLVVSQRGYNTMHRDQLAVASLTLTKEHAQLQVLQGSCKLPLAWFSEDSPLYAAAYLLLGEPLQLWLYFGEVLLL